MDKEVVNILMINVWQFLMNKTFFILIFGLMFIGLASGATVHEELEDE